MKKSKKSHFELIKSTHPGRPDINYFLPKEDKKVMKALLKPIVFPQDCQKVCSKTITLLPKRTIEGHAGMGYFMINVDGYRYINAYVISSALNSSNQKGFTLEISFSVNDFVYGVGVVGETRYFFNFDNYYNTAEFEKKIIHCATSYVVSDGSMHIGGVDLTHLLRVPVMGPYIRASVFNEDDSSHDVEVKAYLTT